MVTESKIECTDRLRRAGLWQEASKYKDEAKQRHRDAGKSRKEAGELAWAEMQEKYPAIPAEADELLDWLALIKFLPRREFQDAEQETRYRALWFAFFMIAAVLQYFRVPSANRGWAGRVISECLLEEAPDPLRHTYVLVIMGLIDPQTMAKHMADTIERRLACLPDTDDGATETEELIWMLGQKDIVLPGPLEKTPI